MRSVFVLTGAGRTAALAIFGAASLAGGAEAAAKPCPALGQPPEMATLVYPSGERSLLTALPQQRTRIEHFNAEGAVTGVEITASGAFLERAGDPNGGYMTIQRTPDPLSMLPFEAGETQIFQTVVTFGDGAVAQTETIVRVIDVAQVTLPTLGCAYELALIEYVYPTDAEPVAVYAYYAPALRANVLNNVTGAELDPSTIDPSSLPAQILTAR